MFCDQRAFVTFAAMPIEFYKYHGTGNDFILIDNREGEFDSTDSALVVAMCNRRTGIGSDGLILIEEHPSADFSMVYFNADGKLGSLCGNGGRCITHLARYLNLIGTRAKFEASDGMHESKISGDHVELLMNNVTSIKHADNHYFLDTGSPHHVELVDELGSFDVFTIGRELRYKLYGEEGANINFVEAVGNDSFAVRTYERGVEDETLSCGTGVVAVALAMYTDGKTNSQNISLQTQGGMLEVNFKPVGNGFEEIWLKGPAKMVYKGYWT